MSDLIDVLGYRNIVGFYLGFCIAGAVVCLVLLLKRPSEIGARGAGGSNTVIWTVPPGTENIKIETHAGGGGPSRDNSPWGTYPGEGFGGGGKP